MGINEKLSTLDMKATLSSLWIFFLFNMIFRDIHELFRPGYLQEIMTEMQVSEVTLLGAGILLEILILMVVLARVLPYRLNRWANVIAGTLAIASLLANGVNDLDDIFFMAVELIALSTIIMLAWRWSDPATEASQSFTSTHLQAD